MKSRVLTEASTVWLLNNNYGLDLKLSKDFCSYDAEDSRYIVEIKNRRKYYDTKLVEAMKLYTNYQKSQLKGKDFLYVVTDEKGVFIYNITKEIKNIVRLNAKVMKQPASTDFSSSKWINKCIYELPESLAGTKKIWNNEC